jgi:hypothetical protein
MLRVADINGDGNSDFRYSERPTSSHVRNVGNLVEAFRFLSRLNLHQPATSTDRHARLGCTEIRVCTERYVSPLTAR